MGNDSMPSEKNDSLKHKVSDNPAASLQSDVSDPRNYYKYAFLQSLTSTVLLDTTGRIIAANDAFEKLFGIPAEIFIKSDHSFITDPELVRKGIADMIIRCVNEKKVFEWTGEFDGAEAAKLSSFKQFTKIKLTLRTRFSPVFDESGNVEAIMLQHEDITQKRLLESDLNETSSLLEAAQNVSKTGHFSADLITGKWLYSEVIDEMLGLESKTVNSVDDWGVIISEDQGKDSFREFVNLDGNNEYHSSDFRIKRKKDGEIKWVSVSCRLEKDSDGKPLRIAGTLQDITQRKLIEHELIQSSRKYQALVDQASDSIFVFDKQGRITEVNEEGCKTLGYTREEMMVKYIWDLTEPDSHKMILKSIARMEEGENVAVMRKLIRKNGEVILAEITGRMLSDGQFQAIARDVTERVRLEEIFKAKEHQFRVIFENMPVGVVFQNEIGFITMANSAAQDILGLSLEQLQGKHSMDPEWRAIHEDGSDYPGPSHPAMISLRTGKPVKNAVMGVFNSKNKAYRWLKINSVPEFKEGSGIVTGVFTTLEDITDIRLTTLALEESERNYKKIFNATSDAIFIDDAATGRIIDVNETMLKMYGYENKEDILKLNVGELSADRGPYDEENAQKMIRRSIDSGPQIFEWLAKKKNGDLFWVEVSLIKTDIGGKGRVLAVARDITERKKAEEKIKRYNLELKNSNSTKDKFLSIIAHDLRSPFHTVLGLSEILYDDIENLEREEIKKISYNLHSVLKRQYDLVNDLLDWARLQSKDYRIRTKNEKFDEIVNDVVEIMNPVAEGKGIIIKTEVDVPDEVLLDAQMIRLVLRNLISNSVKFSETGSVITLEAAIIHSEDKNSSLNVSVTDTGTGIPAEDLNLLFRADTRYTKKGTREEKGSGLGLLLCYEVVKKHGGEIEIKSDTGKGCRVSFSIPAGSQVC